MTIVDKKVENIFKEHLRDLKEKKIFKRSSKILVKGMGDSILGVP
jgi:hypothetical protein